MFFDFFRAENNLALHIDIFKYVCYNKRKKREVYHVSKRSRSR